MTATLHTPMSVPPGVRARTWTTPGWLRLLSTALVAVILVAAVTATVAEISRQHAADGAKANAEPLLTDAQTAYVTMSDANTTIAGAFLAGPVVTTGAQKTFDQDLALSAEAITSAAQRGGQNASLGGTLTTLTTGLTLYRSAIATAEAENRLGYPVASAYLTEANGLMVNTLLPAAQSLYVAEQQGLAKEDSRATATAWLVVLIVLLAVALAVAVWLQLDLARRFRRTLNAGLAVATVLLAGGMVWAAVTSAAADHSVQAAEHHGTTPLAALTEARILAQQARADDELALVTRDPKLIYQNDYNRTAPNLSKALSVTHSGWTAAEQADLAQATTAWSRYQADRLVVKSADPNKPATVLADGATGGQMRAARWTTRWWPGSAARRAPSAPAPGPRRRTRPGWSSAWPPSCWSPPDWSWSGWSRG